MTQPADGTGPCEPGNLSTIPGPISGERPSPDPRFDPSVAQAARVYNYWLGGKDHYLADRKAAQEVMRLRPQVVASARANRSFLARVVRLLAAECGIRQFLDVGTGMPAPDNTHEVAQRAAPESSVVYVDNDPQVLAHARALLSSTTVEGTCGYVEADLREPETILAQAARTLDFTRPAAILLLAVLHFIEDAAGPARYDPVMLLAVWMYAYLRGVLSTRAVEDRCRYDATFRVACGREVPDHTTFSRFRQHLFAQAGLAEDLFYQVLYVCAGAGLGRLGVVAGDGV